MGCPQCSPFQYLIITYKTTVQNTNGWKTSASALRKYVIGWINFLPPKSRFCTPIFKLGYMPRFRIFDVFIRLCSYHYIFDVMVGGCWNAVRISVRDSWDVLTAGMSMSDLQEFDCAMSVVEDCLSGIAPATLADTTLQRWEGIEQGSSHESAVHEWRHALVWIFQTSESSIVFRTCWWHSEKLVANEPGIMQVFKRGFAQTNIFSAAAIIAASSWLLMGSSIPIDVQTDLTSKNQTTHLYAPWWSNWCKFVGN